MELPIKDLSCVCRSVALGQHTIEGIREANTEGLAKFKGKSYVVDQYGEDYVEESDPGFNNRLSFMGGS